MAYVDYAYYLKEFHGTLPKEAFYRFCPMACAYLDSAVMGRVPQPVPEAVKLAACALTELFCRQAEKEGISSEDNDGYRVTWAKEDTNKAAGSVLWRYLANTGLLYRGIG